MVYSSIQNFKSVTPEYKRKNDASRLLERYPDKRPVILIKGSKETPEIDRFKYMVHSDMNIAEFLSIIRKHIKITKDQAIFLMVNNAIVKQSDIIKTIYNSDKDPDGLLYITYVVESTFG